MVLKSVTQLLKMTNIEAIMLHSYPNTVATKYSQLQFYVDNSVFTNQITLEPTPCKLDIHTPFTFAG